MKMLLPTYALFALTLSSSVRAGHDGAPWVCPHFTEITKKAETEAFETRSKSMASSVDLYKFAEPYMEILHRQNPSKPDSFKFQIGGGTGNPGGKMFSLDWGPQTPLKEGFQMRIDYHLYDGKVQTRYVKLKADHFKTAKVITNINVYQFDSIPHYVGIELTILLDDPKPTYRVTAKFFPDYWKYDSGSLGTS